MEKIQAIANQASQSIKIIGSQNSQSCSSNPFKRDRRPSIDEELRQFQNIKKMRKNSINSISNIYQTCYPKLFDIEQLISSANSLYSIEKKHDIEFQYPSFDDFGAISCEEREINANNLQNHTSITYLLSQISNFHLTNSQYQDQKRNHQSLAQKQESNEFQIMIRSNEMNHTIYTCFDDEVPILTKNISFADGQFPYSTDQQTPIFKNVPITIFIDYQSLKQGGPIHNHLMMKIQDNQYQQETQSEDTDRLNILNLKNFSVQKNNSNDCLFRLVYRGYHKCVIKIQMENLQDSKHFLDALHISNYNFHNI